MASNGPGACPEIRFRVAQATGLYRPATRRAERGARLEPIKTGLLLCEAAAAGALLTAALRSASRPCYPFFGLALSRRAPNRSRMELVSFRALVHSGQ